MIEKNILSEEAIIEYNYYLESCLMDGCEPYDFDEWFNEIYMIEVSSLPIGDK